MHSAVPSLKSKRPAQGEGHGFRGATAIRRALDGELYFYGKVRPSTEKQKVKCWQFSKRRFSAIGAQVACDAQQKIFINALSYHPSTGVCAA